MSQIVGGTNKVIVVVAIIVVVVVVIIVVVVAIIVVVVVVIIIKMNRCPEKRKTMSYKRVYLFTTSGQLKPAQTK